MQKKQGKPSGRGKRSGGTSGGKCPGGKNVLHAGFDGPACLSKEWGRVNLTHTLNSGPRNVWGPAVAQKYKVHQNALFKKQNSKIFSRVGLRENVSPGPALAFDGPACT